MNKKLNRMLAGTLSIMFIGQALIYGDGSSQGIAHAETITEIKESLQLSENADNLAADYEKAVDGLGEIEYFGSPEATVMLMSEAAETDSLDFAEDLTITGYVKKGVVSGCAASDDTPIYVRIFNGDWAELKFTEISDGEKFIINASVAKSEGDSFSPKVLFVSPAHTACRLIEVQQ